MFFPFPCTGAGMHSPASGYSAMFTRRVALSLAELLSVTSIKTVKALGRLPPSARANIEFGTIDINGNQTKVCR